MHMDLIDECVEPVSLPFSQRNSRYDGQIAVFGTKLQDVLAKQRYFLVSRPVENFPTLPLASCC